MKEDGSNPDGNPDTELMLRFQKGEEGAFDRLVERHRGRIVAMMTRYLGNGEAAEDAAQDVFVRMYRARGKYRPTAKFSTWLYRIAVNHALNKVRDGKLRRLRTLEAGRYRNPVEDSGPDAALEQEELRRVVRDALESLPPQQRMAVLLARFEELPYNDICRVMDLSLSALKSLVFRAKENLRRVLEHRRQD